MAQFLDLPPEIRNMIYEFALPAGRTYTFACRRPNAPKVDIGILSVSRMIRQEALFVWNAANTFKAYGCPISCPRGKTESKILKTLLDPGAKRLAGVADFRWSHQCVTPIRLLDSHDGEMRWLLEPSVSIRVRGNDCSIRISDIRSKPANDAEKKRRLAEKRQIDARESALKMLESLEGATGKRLKIHRYVFERLI